MGSPHMTISYVLLLIRMSENLTKCENFWQFCYKWFKNFISYILIIACTNTLQNKTDRADCDHAI